MNKAWIGAVVVLVGLVAIRVVLTMSARTSDQDQIRTAVAESIELSKDGKPGGLMELLGSQLTVNSQDASGAMSQVADFIKKQHPDVKFDHIDPLVTGDRAQVTSPATVDLNFLGQHRTFHLREVLLIFKREPGTKWFVIPTEKWRLEQVEVPNFSPEDLVGSD
jgi:hypothetical protein